MTHKDIIAELYRRREEAANKIIEKRKGQQSKKLESVVGVRLAEYYIGLECAYMQAITMLEHGDGSQRS